MITKFDRMQIASINDTHSAAAKRNRVLQSTAKTVAVPQEETFKYVFDNAKKGNEFAAVLIDEWQKNCDPKNDKENKVFQLINVASKKIFE